MTIKEILSQSAKLYYLEFKVTAGESICWFEINLNQLENNTFYYEKETLNIKDIEDIDTKDLIQFYIENDIYSEPEKIYPYALVNIDKTLLSHKYPKIYEKVQNKIEDSIKKEFKECEQQYKYYNKKFINSEIITFIAAMLCIISIIYESMLSTIETLDSFNIIFSSVMSFALILANLHCVMEHKYNKKQYTKKYKIMAEEIKYIK